MSKPDHLTAVKVYLPSTPFETIRTAIGYDENGDYWTFAGDARPMEGLREAIETYGEVVVEVEEWQIHGKVNPPEEKPTFTVIEGGGEG